MSSYLDAEARKSRTLDVHMLACQEATCPEPIEAFVNEIYSSSNLKVTDNKLRPTQSAPQCELICLFKHVNEIGYIEIGYIKKKSPKSAPVHPSSAHARWQQYKAFLTLLVAQCLWERVSKLKPQRMLTAPPVFT